MASLLREAAARAHDFLLEAAPPVPVERRHSHSGPEVVVFGLSAGCGATTLARGLALALQAPGRPPPRVLEIGDATGGEGVPAAPDTLALVWDAGSGDAPL